jgi:alanine dehydrogenase
VAGLKPDRTSPDEITVFTSTSLAAQNVAIANLAYKKALAKGLGKLV